MTVIYDKGNPLFFGNKDLINLMIFKDQRSKFIVSFSILQLYIGVFAREILVYRVGGGINMYGKHWMYCGDCTDYYESLLNLV